MRKYLLHVLIISFVLLCNFGYVSTPFTQKTYASSDGSNVHDNLPQSYSGSFQWHGNQSMQYVTISINNILTDLEDNVIAEGNGFYEAKGYDNTAINIKIKITPSTLRFEMWEMNPTGSGDYETDGSHVGTISNDLKSIQAVWTTKGSGEQGDLKLKAK